MLEVFSQNKKETQKIAKFLAEEIKNLKTNKAIVIALEGNLGSGKTTFSQGFIGALGVNEKIKSPTFVLMKTYAPKALRGKKAVHIDCYRIKSEKETDRLGLNKIFKNPDSVVLIEWAERVKKLLPAETIWIKFFHTGRETERKLIFEL